MDADANRQLVQDYLAAQQRGDVPRMKACLDDDVVWRLQESAGIPAPRGRREVMRAMAKTAGSVFDLSTLRNEIHWIVAEDDKVVVRLRTEARAANGRDYANEYVWIYFCRNGKITEIEEHTDSQRFYEIVKS